MKKVLIVGNEVTQSVTANEKNIVEIIAEQKTYEITNTIDRFESSLGSYKSGQELRRERRKNQRK